jgi:hypothetical protein
MGKLHSISLKIETDRRTDRPSDRQTNWQTNQRTDKQTDGQTDRPQTDVPPMTRAHARNTRLLFAGYAKTTDKARMVKWSAFLGCFVTKNFLSLLL